MIPNSPSIKRAIAVLLIIGMKFLSAQTPDTTAEPQTILLWEDAAPGALGTAAEEKPTITVYRPFDRSKGLVHTVVIVAPGGAYGHLALNHEGRQVANWLNSLGVTAFVLSYRLGPRYHYPVELGDAQRAIRLVRSRAQEFDIAPDRVGFMGFSAGGHLASMAGTHFDNGNPSATDPADRISSRPDFLILGYPVIFLRGPYAHQASAKNLLGEHPDPKLLQQLSTASQVTSQTPPTFLFTTSEDKTVPAENSVAFYLALHRAGVPAELHVFEKGPHGVGLDLADPLLAEWSALLANWLRARCLLDQNWR